MTTVVVGAREAEVKAHAATIYRAPLDGAPPAALQRAWDAVCAGFAVAPVLIFLAPEDYRAYPIAFNGCLLLPRRRWPVGVAGFLCDEPAVIVDPPPPDRRNPVWAVG